MQCSRVRSLNAPSAALQHLGRIGWLTPGALSLQAGGDSHLSPAGWLGLRAWFSVWLPPSSDPLRVWSPERAHLLRTKISIRPFELTGNTSSAGSYWLRSVFDVGAADEKFTAGPLCGNKFVAWQIERCCSVSAHLRRQGPKCHVFVRALSQPCMYESNLPIDY